MQNKNRFKIALASGGGGVRGLAHIGILKVLRSHSIPLDLIVGTSMGAIVGATYCLEPDAKRVETKILEALDCPQIKSLESFFKQASEENQPKLIVQKLLSRIKDLYLWNLQAGRKWLIRSEPIARLLQELLGSHKFSDTKVPFACVALDLNTATDIILNEGPLLKAVLASSSIPGVFAPLKSGDQLLSDGGTLSLVPAAQARDLGADFVIGVDITPAFLKRELVTGLDVRFQADWIKSYYLNKLNLTFCDWIIRPDVLGVSWSMFSQSTFCIQQGELAALRNVEQIKSAILRKKRFHFLKKIISQVKPRAVKA